MNELTIGVNLPLRFLKAGLFSPHFVQPHPTRTLDAFELIFVRQGRFWIAEEDRSFSVGRDEALLLWPGRRHYGTKPNELDLTYYWVYFKLAGNARMTGPATYKVPQHASVAKPDTVLLLLHRLLEESGGVSRSATLAPDLLLLLILAEIAFRPDEAAKSPNEASLAGMANGIVRTSFHEDLNTSSVARKLGCSPDYLGRAYRDAFGVTLTNAIQRTRTEHAKHLLLLDELSLDDIAMECGFQDTGYFRRIFKQLEGMTPRHFQKLNAGLHWQNPD